MGLTKLLQNAAGIAFKVADDLQIVATWSFVSSDGAAYNPTTDTMTAITVTVPLRVLLYKNTFDESKSIFSEAGRFIDPNIEQDSFRVIVQASICGANVPSVADTFTTVDPDTGLTDRYEVRSVERFPGKPVYDMMAVKA